MKGTHIYQTRGIYETCCNDGAFYLEVVNALCKFLSFDWGDTCEADKRLNDRAVKNGDDRLVAKYKTTHGDIFILTEVGTTTTFIMFAHEY